VLHLLGGPDLDAAPVRRAQPPSGAETQVGFVVSKAVGNAVARNRVKRRLRHLAGARLGALPVPAILVVRALPAASAASYAGLGDDFDAALHRVTARPSGDRSRTR